jgi:hypothetical protein
MASEARRLHEQLSDVGLRAANLRWLSWGREYCSAAVIREAEARAEAEEIWQRAITPSSSQVVSAARAPVAGSTAGGAMVPAEDASEAGTRRSTRARKATAKSQAAEVSGATHILAEAEEDEGDEDEASAGMGAASDARGASTTSTVSSKRPAEDEDEDTPAAKRTRSDTVTPGETKRGRKPLPDQEPQVVSRMSSAGEQN